MNSEAQEEIEVSYPETLYPKLWSYLGCSVRLILRDYPAKDVTMILGQGEYCFLAGPWLVFSFYSRMITSQAYL